MEKYIVNAGSFEIGYAELKFGPVPVLDSIVRHFKHTTHTFEVAGHTADNTSSSYNLEISTRRAESVVGYMNFRGIDRTRMSAIGCGASAPIATNTTATGRELNRRVEVSVHPA